MKLLALGRERVVPLLGKGRRELLVALDRKRGKGKESPLNEGPKAGKEKEW